MPLWEGQGLLQMSDKACIPIDNIWYGNKWLWMTVSLGLPWVWTSCCRSERNWGDWIHEGFIKVYIESPLHNLDFFSVARAAVCELLSYYFDVSLSQHWSQTWVIWGFLKLWMANNEVSLGYMKQDMVKTKPVADCQCSASQKYQFGDCADSL